MASRNTHLALGTDHATGQADRVDLGAGHLCLGTALRQGAASVVQLDINPLPGHDRAPYQPWPVYPKVYRASSAHLEARELAGLLSCCSRWASTGRSATAA
jgi:NADPH-dependent glutamate synthase beta subunit-like oxidoreductase